MKIVNNSAVTMHYTVKDDNGQTIDSSEGENPLQFIFGAGLIIPGLERELAGKTIGDKVSVTVQPKDGYGIYNEELVGEVSKDLFQKDHKMHIGMPVKAQNHDGSVQLFTIANIKDETILLDGNHPLAGKILHFAVDITDIREATKEELEQGHIHSETTTEA